MDLTPKTISSFQHHLFLPKLNLWVMTAPGILQVSSGYPYSPSPMSSNISHMLMMPQINFSSQDFFPMVYSCMYKYIYITSVCMFNVHLKTNISRTELSISPIQKSFLTKFPIPVNSTNIHPVAHVKPQGTTWEFSLSSVLHSVP